MSTRRKNRRRTDSGADYVNTYRRVHDENRWRTDSQMMWDCLSRTDSQMLYFRVYDENWYVAHKPIHEMKISGGRSDSRKWTDHRVNWRRTTLVSEVFLETFLRERESEQPSGDNESRRGEEREKNPSLSSPLRDLLSASNDGSLALSRRNISRKTSGPRVAANQFADDLKIVVQVVHTDGQGHSHRRFRGRLCFSLTACRTLKIVLRALRTYR